MNRPFMIRPVSSDDSPGPTAEELARRKAWFEWYVRQLEERSVLASGAGPYACPCCRFVTLPERGGYDICPVCCWEDDGQDELDADIVRGGPNGRLSLTAARANFARIGAKEERHLEHVRAPRPEER
jgi:Cysteine-rich CPCC